MEEIYIDYLLHTPINIDLSDFDFTGVEKIVLTEKKYMNNKKYTVLVKEFTEAKIYTVTVTPEESKRFDGDVRYDFIAFMTNGEVYKVSDVGVMVLREGVGTSE